MPINTDTPDAGVWLHSQDIVPLFLGGFWLADIGPWISIKGVTPTSIYSNSKEDLSSDLSGTDVEPHVQLSQWKWKNESEDNAISLHKGIRKDWIYSE